MSFPLRNAFIVCHRFGYVVPSFSLNSKKSLISPMRSRRQKIIKLRGEINQVETRRTIQIINQIIYVVIEDQP